MTMTIGGTSGLVFPDSSTQNTAATGFGFKNRIINGAMMIDQRNAGASVTATTANEYTLDRWKSSSSVSSKFTVQQSSTAPAGYVNSLLVTSSSAYTVGSGDFFTISQRIEGFNCSDLGFGAVGAATVTLSFWVRSSLTGTFGGSLANSANNRSYPFSYTISSANTWEQKTVTIAGDTTGTWLTTNGIGIRVNFGLGVGTTYSGTAGSWAATEYDSATGATSVVGTNGATFYITGVQLEKGSTATSFDYRPYGTELALCQRYYQVIVADTNKNIGSVFTGSSADVSAYIPFKVEMRTSPTLYTNLTSYRVNTGSADSNSTSTPTISQTNTFSTRFDLAGFSGLTTGNSGILKSNSTGQLAMTAEL